MDKREGYPIPTSFFAIPIIFLVLFVIAQVRVWVSSFHTVSFAVEQNARDILIRSSLPQIPGYKNTFAKALTTLGEDTVTVDHGDKVVFHGPRDRKIVALTFDADMTPGMKKLYDEHQVVSYYNKQLIDLLDATQTKATLFLTGMWIEMYPEVTRELAENKLFELGSHSYSHPSFDGSCFGLGEIPDNQDQDQIQKTQFLLRTIGGVDAKVFRFPGGCYSNKDVAYVTQSGLQAIQWDVAGVDGFNNNTTSIEENVLRHVQNGSIIVLHMNGYPNDPRTADAMPMIITKLKEEGYSFVTVSELLDKTSHLQAFELNQLFHVYQ